MSTLETIHYDSVDLEDQGEFVEIRLRRPEKRNAIDRAMSADLGAAVTAASGSGKPLVIRSATRGMFVAGTDLAAIRERDLDESLARTNAKLFQQIAEYPWTTVAVVEGPALGGGMELALACDLRIATEGSRWGLPEVTLGLIPSAGGLVRLPQLVGTGIAKDLILTGRIVTGSEAAALGLAQRLTDDDHLDAVVAQVLEAVGRASPLAARLAKEAMRTDKGDLRLVDALAQSAMLATEGTQALIAGRLA